MKLLIHQQLVICCFAASLAGCSSGRYYQYTAPEITGRVLAADTREPLARVRVLRAGPNGNFEAFGPPKGGQQMLQPVPVVTDDDGRFVLASKSVFAPFRQAGWWSAPVSYQRQGYQTFSTNYTASNVISNTPAGAPVVDAGEVLLKPAKR
jgi:hypothetical protein